MGRGLGVDQERAINLFWEEVAAMTPEEAKLEMERRAAKLGMVNPEESVDLVSAYREKVAEHATLSAANWQTDWKKYIDGVVQQTDLTRSDALLWQTVLLQKEIITRLANLESSLFSILADVRLLHLHHHGIESHKDCEKMLAYYEKEPWQQ